ncbi:MAG: hypothetical protein KDK25_06760 [Leptospiraceae bacterium]|nr:hypothetical protein [Leptospiraceae bacterium]
MSFQYFIICAIYFTLAGLTLHCGQEAYSDVYFDSDGIQGYGEVDPDNTVRESYYLFERDFLGNLEQVKYVSIPSPESTMEDGILKNQAIQPNPDDSTLYNIEVLAETARETIVYPAQLKMKTVEDGVLLYKRNQTGHLFLFGEFPATAIHYSSSPSERIVSLRGLKGSPVESRESGVHAERFVLDERGRVQSIQKLDAENKPRDPFNGSPHEVRFQYSDNSIHPVKKMAFDTEGKPAKLSDSECHSIEMSYDDEERLESRSCFDLEGKPTLFHSSSHPYHSIVYSVDPDTEAIVKSFRDTEGKPATEGNENYTRIIRKGKPADPTIETVYEDERSEEDPGPGIIIQQNEEGRLLSYSCFEKESPAKCKQGWHKLEQKFEKGQRTLRAYYDIEGNPVVDPLTRLAREEWTYDEKGRLTGYRIMDAEGNLSIPAEVERGNTRKAAANAKLQAAAGFRIEYQKEGEKPVRFSYLGVDGKPYLHPEEKFAIKSMEYPEKEIAIYCFYGADESPEIIEGGNGNCLRNKMDSLGRIRSRAIFQEDGKAGTNQRMGHHLEKYEMDDRNFLTSVKMFDREGKPMNARIARVHEIRYKTLPTGQLKEIAYFDKEGNPSEDGSFTHRRVNYFKEGKLYKSESYRKNGSVRFSFDY